MAPDDVMSNLSTTLLQKYWWVFLLIIGLKILEMFIPKMKGRIGEGVVNLAAKLRLNPKVYHLIKDVTVPAQNGTTQIDHVIVSKFGLFVIETKNYKGWIFADAKDRQWTQVNFKQKHRFQNPLRQNYGHICALSELLGLPKENIHGVVCFMGDAKFKTKVPAGVFIQGSYITHIKSFKTSVFSETEVTHLIQRIESGRLKRGFKTNRAHVQQLNNRKAQVGGRKTEGRDQKSEDKGQKSEAKIQKTDVGSQTSRVKNQRSITDGQKIIRPPKIILTLIVLPTLHKNPHPPKKMILPPMILPITPNPYSVRNAEQKWFCAPQSAVPMLATNSGDVPISLPAVRSFKSLNVKTVFYEPSTQ